MRDGWERSTAVWRVRGTVVAGEALDGRRHNLGYCEMIPGSERSSLGVTIKAEGRRELLRDDQVGENAEVDSPSLPTSLAQVGQTTGIASWEHHLVQSISSYVQIYSRPPLTQCTQQDPLIVLHTSLQFRYSQRLMIRMCHQDRAGTI